MLPAQLPFAFDAWDRFLIYERRVAAPGQATMTRRASRLEHRATRGLPPSLAASFHVRDHSTAASDAPSVPMTDAALPAGSGSLQCYSEICIFAGRSKAKGGAKVPPPASTAVSGPATPGSAAPGTPDAPSTLHLDDVSQPEVGRSAAASPAAKRSKDPPMFQLLRIPRTNNPKLQCVVASTTFESEEAARHYAKRRRLTPLMDAVALIGAVRFTMGYYLVLVTRRSQCAVLGAHPVYDIKQTQLLYIGEHNRDQTQGDEQRLRDTFLVLDLKSGAFFYSYTLDLTHPLQRVMAAQRPPAPRDKFVWNSFLAEPWRQCDLGELVVPIVRGCVLQRHMTIGTSSVLLTMVVRGSKRFAGARYLKRGVNEEGHVANHVEVEQIVSDESQMSPDRSRGAFTSFVQVRGSVPVFWCHDGGLKPKPAILYDRIDNTYKATKCHFGELFADYGAPVVILNLLKEQERKPREIHLSAAFRRAIDTIVAPLGQQAKPSPGEPFDPPLQYAAFDFRNRTREAWNELTAIAEYVVDRVGFFHTSPKGALRWQCGVARSNCVDCVDRTNYGQFFTGLHALSHQLVALNVFECPTDIATTPALREQLLLLYTELGDRIATQYGGSMVVSAGLFDRGLGWDKFMGLKRFYTNRFEDDERQRATNLFLGLYRPCVPRPLPGTVVSVDCPSAYQVPPRPTAETSLLASMWRMVRSEQVQALPGEDSVWVRAIDIDQLDSDYYLHVKHPVAMLALHEGQVPAALMSPTNLAGSIRPLMPGPRASAAPPPPQPMAFVANSFGQSPKDNVPLPGSMASIPDHALQPASMPRSEEVLGARDRDGPTSQGSLHIPAPELDSTPILARDEPQPESQPQSAEPQPQDGAANASVEKPTTPTRRDGNNDDDDDDGNVDDPQRCGGSAEAEAAGSNGVSVEGQSDPVPVSAMTPSTLKGGSVGGGMEGASVSDLFGPYATTTSVTAVATPAPTPVGACVSPPPEHEMVLSRNPGLNLEAGGMLLRKDSTLVEMALETRDAEPNQWLAVALAQHSKSCAMRTAPGPRPRDAGHDIEYELGKLALPSDLFRIVDVSTQTHIPLQKYEKLDALNAQAARHQKPPYVCKQEMNETRPPDPPPRSYTAPPIDYSVMTDITAYAEEVERSPYCVAEEKMLQIAQDAVQPRKHEDITEQEWRVMGLSLQQPGPYTAWSIDDLCSALKAFRWQRGPPLRHLANELTAMMTSLYFARPSDAVGGFFRAFLVPPSLARSERKVHVTPARRQMGSVSASPGPNTQADTRPPTPQAPSVTPPATPLVPVTFPALTPPRKVPTVSMAALDAPGSGVSPRPVTPQSVLRRDRARTAPLAVFDPVGTLEQWYVVSATDEDRGWIRDFVAAAKHCPRRAVAADYEAYVQGSDTVMRRMLGAAPTPTVHPLTTFLNTTATQVELERRVRGWLSLICDPRDGIRPQNRVRYVNADSIRIPRGVIHLNVFSGHNLVSWVVSNAHHLKITLPGHSAWNAASTFASLLITSGLLHAVTSSTTTAAAAQDRTIVSDTTRFTRSVEPRALYRLLCHEPRHVFQPPVAMARPTEALTPDDIMVLSHTVCNLALQYLDEATATHQSLIESVSSQLLPALEFCSLQALTPGMRACLFTNLYNTLYCLIVARCRRRNQRFDIDIAEHTQYIVVAGMQFSLADIKHGILRGNAPHPRMLLPQISEDDSRLRLVLDSPDPRCVMLLLDFVEGRVDSSDKAKNPQAPNSSDSEDSDPDDDEDEDEDEAVAASKHTTRVKETNQRLASTPTAAPLPLPPSSSELAAEDLTTGWFWWWRTESRGELDLLKCTAVLYDDWHQRLQLAASHTLHLLSSGYAGEGAAGAKPSDSAARVMQTLRTLPEFGSSRESVFRRLRDVSRR